MLLQRLAVATPLTAILCSIALMLSAPAQADEQALRLAPADNWTAEFADEFCALRRSFGNGEHSVFFELKQFVPGRGMEITIASQTLERRDHTFRVAFLPGETENPGVYRRVDTDDGWQGYIYPGRLEPHGVASLVRGSAQAQERDSTITGYAVENGFSEDFVLETGPMHEVAAVLDQCTDDLVAGWGLDPEQQRNLSQTVRIGTPASWLRDYLSRAERIEREFGIGRLQLVLLVDAAGEVTRCSGIDLPEEVRQENRACEYLMDRRRFEPALDAEGHPVASFHLMSGRAIRTTSSVTFGL